MKQVHLLHGIEMIPTPHDPIPKAPAREVWNPRGPSVHHSSYDPVMEIHGISELGWGESRNPKAETCGSHVFNAVSCNFKIQIDTALYYNMTVYYHFFLLASRNHCNTLKPRPLLCPKVCPGSWQLHGWVGMGQNVAMEKKTKENTRVSHCCHWYCAVARP